MNSQNEEPLKVYSRLRPPGNAVPRTTVIVSPTEVNINNEYTCKLDGCFSAASSQDEVFNTVASPIVDSVLQGHNGTIMAYGNTSTGKTFTMFGSDGQEGIVYQCLHKLFEAAEGDPKSTFEFSASYVQIYCEVIYDLLDPDKNLLYLRESDEAGLYVENVTKLKITDLRKAMLDIKSATRNWAQASTNLKEASSRSHTFLNIEVIKTCTKERTAPKILRSSLCLVDLVSN